MNKRFAKVLSLALALMMILSVVPATVLAKGFTAVSTLGGKLIQRTAPETYPEQTLTQEAGGVSVTVESPEGALPKGTSMSVEGVEDIDAVQAAIYNAQIEGIVLTAVDITFMNDGREIQPKHEVTVTMSSSVLAGKNGLRVVHVKDSNGAKAGEIEEVENVVVNGSKVTFMADSFSVYAVIGDGQFDDRVRVTIEFYTSTRENAVPVDSCIVTPHDAVQGILDNIIPDPSINGSVAQDENLRRFMGWTMNADYTDKDVNGDCTIRYVRNFMRDYLAGNPEDGKVFKVYAMYFNYFIVTYRNETDTVTLSREVVYTKSNTYDLELNKLYSPELKGYRFAGWQIDGQGQVYAYGSTIEGLSGNVTLVANVEKGIWITFIESPRVKGVDPETGNTTYSYPYKGATYNPPVFIKAGSDNYAHVTTAYKPSPDPVLPGYDFIGWCTDWNEDTGVASNFYSFNETTIDDVTVYAKWELKNQVDVSVIVWLENIDGSGYTYSRTITLSAAPNTQYNPISGTAGAESITVGGQTVSEPGFVYKEGTTGTKKVEPNGSTTYDVYFIRKTYTLTFQALPIYNTAGVSNGWKNVYYFDGDDLEYESQGLYLYNGKWYTSSTTTSANEWRGGVYSGSTYSEVKTITARYGEDISSYFPIVGNNGVTYNHGERWKPQSGNPVGWKEVMVKVMTMPAGDVTFRINYPDRPLKTMNYYVEALPGDTGTVSAPTLYTGKNNTVVPSGDYSSMSFKLLFSIDARYNGVTEEDILSLPGYEIIGVDKQGETRNNTFFYIYDESNPGTINIYYKRVTRSIIYADGLYLDGNKNPDESVTPRNLIHEDSGIRYQEDISSYNLGGANEYVPNLYGYKFMGWYTAPTCTNDQAANLSTMPLNGVVLYAKWQLLQIRVALDTCIDSHPGTGLPTGQDDSFRITMYDMISDGQIIIPTRESDSADFVWEFVGWFTDKDYEDDFNFAMRLYYVEGDSSSTAENYTTEDRATYGDTLAKGRDNVVGIRKLYAKWRKLFSKAEGITIIYHGQDTLSRTGEGKILAGEQGYVYDYSDPITYGDAAKAIGLPGADPRWDSAAQDPGYSFLYWQIANPDGSLSDEVVYPGQEFDVDFAYASQIPIGKGVMYQIADTFREESEAVPEKVVKAEPTRDAVTTTVFSCGFESTDDMSDWATYDADGDGNNWATYEDSGYSHNGSKFALSYSYYNSTALNPNNYLITPGIAIPAEGTTTLEFYARALNSSYLDHFRVLVSTSAESASDITGGTVIIADTQSTGSWKQYTADLTQFKGQTIYISFNHANSYNLVALGVDDVAVTNSYDSNAAVEVWAPVDDPVDGEEYLIGYTASDGTTYLLMSYNPATATYYGSASVSSGSTTYTATQICYAIPAVKDGDYVTGVVTTNHAGATLLHTQWIFNSESSGKYNIQSVYNNDYYLRIGTDSSSSTNNLNLYPATYNSSYGVSWVWENSKLSHNYGGSYLRKYLGVLTSSGVPSYFMAISNSTNAATIQLYHKELLTPAKEYTVEFYAWDQETVIKTVTVNEGETAEPPTDGEVQATAPSNYTFDSWQGTEYINVSGEERTIKVYPKFNLVGKPSYVVRFVNWDGTLIVSQTVEEGEDATPPTTGIKPREGYTFADWQGNYKNVTANVTIRARFIKTVTMRYVIDLYAYYIPDVEVKETHIYWYQNDNNTDINYGAGDRQVDEPVRMNQLVEIPTPYTFTPEQTGGSKAEGEMTLVRPGYEFVGWARMPISLEMSENPETYQPAYQDLICEDPAQFFALNGSAEYEDIQFFLKWNPDENETGGGHFTTLNKNGQEATVKYVAADEFLPYHDMYAVWKPTMVFYVYHSSDNTVETVTIGDPKYPSLKYDEQKGGITFDITSLVKKGNTKDGLPEYLYGGYYKKYNKASEFDPANPYSVDPNHKPYKGGAGYWSMSNAWKAQPEVRNNVKEGGCGTAMFPVAGEIYYLKEVPSAVLSPWVQVIYAKGTHKIINMYIVSVIDDANYLERSLGITDVDVTPKLTYRLVVKDADGNPEATLTPQSVSRNGLEGGYVTFANIDLSEPLATYVYTPWYETPDGYVVEGLKIRTIVYGDGEIDIEHYNANTQTIPDGWTHFYITQDTINPVYTGND
ncbi:MAG: choice-of-anchor J domain-containing protein [Clostridiales bacterium]|nr:choice-of-anchor J domain-containing protein [Clostridiales bacterium]